MNTHTEALPAGLQRLVHKALDRQPWRNGLGWTSLVADHHVNEHLVWRVSIAEIQAASSFSHFPALDRTAVLLQGGPLQLIGPDRHWDLHHPGDTAQFPGEADIANTSPGQEALIWNVMAHRERGHAEVSVRQGQALSLAAEGQTLAWVLEGHFEVTGPQCPPGLQVSAGEGLRWSGACQGPTLVPTSAQARVLCTRLRD
ncbi:MAG: HutD family protein [Burkholderiaceae bacterium]|nr:HutD family protein [Burkholderiaceae bacterium]